ncbi:MAG: family 16 glycosylhydrolase [Ruminococcus sp.]|nr:family 16 glycosylhydrolase [Ruminococcus sp.]
MNKKLICTALAASMLLAGCGEAESSVSEDTTAGTTEPATETATEENVEVPELDGYSLLWHDEFSGSALDDSIWSMEARQPGWTNEELQEYTMQTDNIFTRDGKLVLKAIKTDENGKPYYTSGKVNSHNKMDFTYGKVVARAKVPEGQGLWPAIWMMPKDESYYGQWPKCGEIDIMEVLGSDVKTAYGTVHYGEPHAEQQGTVVLDSGSFASDFHDYSVEWEPGEMRWYIDDELYLTVNDWFTAEQGQDDKPYPAPFDQPFFVQMNLAVGGTWPGDPDDSTDFDKAEFLIDYVRVYQKPEYDTNVKKPEKVFREATEDGNFIYNGDFSEQEDLTDDENWKFLLFEGGEGAAEIKDNTMIITTEKEGNVDYSVQLVQPLLPMIKGKKYRVTFDAWSDEERDVIVCVSAPNAGWIRYFPDTLLTLSTEQTTYSYDFDMKEKDDENGRLEFNMGNKGSTATIYIKNVRVEEIE